MLFATVHPYKFWLLYPYWWYFAYDKEYTFEQAEKEYLQYRRKLGGYFPFEESTSFLESFKAKKQEGDKLYLYRSPTRNWFRLAGVEKFILVRDGKTIASSRIYGN